MTFIIYKMIAALLILIVTLIAVLYPLRAAKSLNHHFLDLGDAFASGVFLGAALFHMLPESASQFKELFPMLHYPFAEFLCAGGFLLLLFLERLSFSSLKNRITLPYVLCIIIIVHSLIEGAVLGINNDLSILTILFLAVIAHKGSESFAISISLTRMTVNLNFLMVLIGLFVVATPIGILLGTGSDAFLKAREGLLVTAGFNAFAAGTFLYMSTLHHINHHQRLHESENLLEFFCLFVGLSVMALIGFL